MVCGLGVAVVVLLTSSTFAFQSAANYRDVFPTHPLGGSIAYRCPDDYMLIGSHCFRVFTETLERHNADDICRNEGGGRLATPTFHGLNLDLGDAVRTAGVVGAFYFGYIHDSTQPEDLVAPNGGVHSVLVGHWAAQQPTGDGITCVTADASSPEYDWSLSSCDVSRPFVCQRGGCVPGEFFCLDGGCVKDDYVCDGHAQCGDSSDEFHNSCFSGCGDVFTTAVIFTSPNYPNPYPNNANCLWVLQAPYSSVVELQIDSVNTEESSDFVEIYDGGLTSLRSSKMKSISGSHPQKQLISSGPYMVVRFTSNGDTVGHDQNTPQGFSASWRPVGRYSALLPASATPQTLVSPDYCNARFVYTIKADLKYTLVTIKVESFDVAADALLEIQNEEGGVVHSFTSASPPPEYLVSGSSHVKVEYFTGCGSSNGFTLEYFTGCSYDVSNSTTAVISVPASHNGCVTPCMWSICSPDGEGLTWQTDEGLLTYFDDEADWRSDMNGMETGSYIHSSSGCIYVRYSPRTTGSLSARVSIDCPVYSTTNFAPGNFSQMFGFSNDLQCDVGYTFNLFDDLAGTDTCADHYGMTWSPERVTCEFGGMWSTAIPTCRAVHCGPAPKVENGFVTTVTTFEYQGEADYDCFTGFSRSGGIYVCGPTGEWTPNGDEAPACTAVTCAAAEVIDRGDYRVITGTAAKYGYIVEYSCDVGYVMTTGSSIIVCNGSSGYTSSAPTCSRIWCRIPYFLNANYIPYPQSQLQYEEDIVITCNTGFVLSDGRNSTTSVCQANSSLSWLGGCTNENECLPSPSPCQQICTDTIGSYECSCDPGYMLESDGSSCTEIDECLSDPCDVTYGACTDGLNSYSCSCSNTMYELFMVNGTHGYEIPPEETGTRPGDVYQLNHTCVAKRCQASDIAVVENGEFHLSGQTWYDSGQSVSFYCDHGYTLVGEDDTYHTSIMCGNDSTWSLPYPSCEVVTCPTLALTGSVSPYGEIFTRPCDGDEDVPTSMELTCAYYQDSDQFVMIGGSILCTRVDCGTPIYPHQANITLQNTTVGASFLFQCEDGYEVKGESLSPSSPLVTCDEDGTWGYGTLHCLHVTCPAPGAPPDGRIVGEVSYEVGAVITFACNGDLSPEPIAIECLNGVPPVWNDTTLPRCIDTVPPKCDDKRVELDRYERVCFQTLPRLVKEEVYFLYELIGHEIGQFFTVLDKDAALNWNVSDFDNSVECQIDTPVQGSYVPEWEFCNSRYEYVTSETALTVRSKSTRNGPAPSVNIDPAKYYSKHVITMTLTGDSTSTITGVTPTDECIFEVWILPKGCQTATFGSLYPGASETVKCTTTTACTVSCPTGQAFGDGLQVHAFTCQDGVFTFGVKNIHEMYPALCSADSACPAGYSGTTACSICPIGTYKAVAGSEACTQCPTGKTTIFEGATSDSYCIDPCLEPLVDKGDGSCRTVGNGRYYNNGASPLCDTGTGTFGGTRGNSPSCMPPCPPGSFSSTGYGINCGKCPHGTYQTQAGQTSCTLCPTGQMTLDDGQTNNTCEVATTCDPIMCDPEGTDQEDPCYFDKAPEILRCNCKPDYYGCDCSMKLDSCSQQDSPCVAGTTCVVPDSGSDRFSCDCEDGSGGEPESCDICGNVTCENFGLCQKTGSATTCLCQEFFTGAMCESAINSTGCVTDPCQNGGTCSDSLVGSYQCVCPYGYTGYDCEVNVDICTEYMDSNVTTCVNGALCVDGDGANFTCDCSTTDGYTGRFCHIPPVDTCDNVECSMHGKCYREYLTGQAMCVCEDYYNSTALDCVPILMDYCSTDPCENGASCTSDIEGPSCACAVGYEGSLCQHNTDDCSATSCLNGGTCTDLFNGYECSCAAGFNGTNCEVDIELCDNCINHVNCTDYTTGYTCHCMDGFTGQDCQTQITYCLSCPCQHGASCNDLINGYNCTCDDGWTGTHCETLSDECGPINPCQNGGNCTTYLGGFFCTCPVGFNGHTCETAVDTCAVGNPCLYGNCSVSPLWDQAQCVCDSANHLGRSCDCLKNPCVQTGACNQHGICTLSPDGSSSCQCDKGYEGERCETDIDECSGHECNYGTCVDGLGYAYCSCDAGVGGVNCNEDNDRDFDIFTSNRTVPLKHTTKLPSGCNDLTVGAWIRFDPANQMGSFLTVLHSASPVTNQIELFKVGNLGMESNLGDIPFIGNVDISAGGEWNYVTTCLSMGNTATLTAGTAESTDRISDIPDLSEQFLAIELGDPTISVALSLVQVWCRCLSVNEIRAITNARGVRTDAADTDMVLDWYFTDYVEDSVYRQAPSQRDDPCPLGTFASNGHQCQDLPSLDPCPRDVGNSVVAIDEPVSITFPEPSVAPQVSLFQNHISGEGFTLGAHPTVLNAIDNANHRTECSLNIYARVGLCELPARPLNGDYTCMSSDLYTGCEPFCMDGYAFAYQTPKLYTCGPLGVFNHIHPLTEFSFPPCGVKGDSPQILTLSWKYRLASYQGTVQRNAIMNILQQRMDELGDNLCLDQCEGTVIEVEIGQPNNTVLVNITVRDVRKEIDMTECGQVMPLEDYIRHLRFTESYFNLDDVQEGSAIEEETFACALQCTPPFASNGECCVECPPGTYYNSTTQSCLPCPLHHYSDEPGQFDCTPCPDTEITTCLGSNSIDDCNPVCPNGTLESQVIMDACVPCPRGTYQPITNPGINATCLPCPDNHTTVDEGSDSEDDCIPYCPCGYEISDIGCRKCKVGTYKENNSTNLLDPCTNCSGNLTTTREGSCSSSYCRDPCHPGTYLRTSASDVCIPCPFDASDVCLPCPVGTYQPNNNPGPDVQCTPCSPLFTTLGNGSDSSNDCIPVTRPVRIVLQLCIFGGFPKWDSSFYDTLVRQDVLRRLLPLVEQWLQSLGGIYLGNLTASSITPGTFATFEGIFDNSTSMAHQMLNSELANEVSTGNNLGQTLFSLCNNYTELILSTEMQCEPGEEYIDTGECVPCPIGFIQPPDFLYQCLPCPSGTTTLQTGSFGEITDQCKGSCDTLDRDYCLHGGTCYMEGDELRCLCIDELFGERCQFIRGKWTDHIPTVVLVPILGLTILFGFIWLGRYLRWYCYPKKSLAPRRPLFRRRLISQPIRRVPVRVPVPVPVRVPVPVPIPVLPVPVPVPTPVAVVGTPALRFSDPTVNAIGYVEVK